MGQPWLSADSRFPSILLLGFGAWVSWGYVSAAGAWEDSTIQDSPTGTNTPERFYVCYSVSSLDVVENLDPKTVRISCPIRKNFVSHWFPWFSFTEM